VYFLLNAYIQILIRLSSRISIFPNPKSFAFALIRYIINFIIRNSLKIRPACLRKDPVLSGNGTAIGWGVTSEGLVLDFKCKFNVNHNKPCQFSDGVKPEELQKVTLDIFDEKICKEGNRQGRTLPRGIIDSQFCAGYALGGKDTCQVIYIYI